jgi:hypothetical protein
MKQQNCCRRVRVQGGYSGSRLAVLLNTLQRAATAMMGESRLMRQALDHTSPLSKPSLKLKLLNSLLPSPLYVYSCDDCLI